MGFKDLFDDLLNRNRPQPVDMPEEAPQPDPVVVRDEEILKRIQQRRKYQEGFYRFLKHPLRVMIEEPYTALFISVPAALLLFIGGFVSIVTSYGFAAIFGTTMLDDVTVFAIIIAIVPFAILDLKESIRVSSVEASLP
ncbi:MAG TPA: type II secretion system F family protein, partial [Methanoculleus sp.]|nr:type II secretion system F family protein [Methanoculleus sp.]